MHKLMMIDDDREVLLLNQKYFENEGYKISVHDNAADALRMIPKEKPDCILLDVMMPGLDGFSALPEIRKLTDCPVIFLTGKDTEEDRVKGLLSGADDYIVKPYSLKELSARILVQLRRRIPLPSTDQRSFPPLTINLMQRKVYYNETEEINLSNREYELLLLLTEKPDHIVTFEDIGNAIWNVYQESDRRSIMVMMSRLRKKLELYKGLEDCIETAYGKGYSFIP
ncbi:DNA-binding response regulator, OmpR family, contains REC and winged-helix (wHTH) domain [Lachnospiraceae bacterium]|nr:DNA-binding response regulator, OmpR family, contains REC and winged-helix (wHTH) domain [Lachnospiraceae bacterium]